MNINAVTKLACLCRTPVDTNQENKIYPLLHTCIVKDIVPDLTLLVEQYKSIKPHLQYNTRSEMERNSVRRERSSTVSTNASYAPATLPHALNIGRTLKIILGQQSYYSLVTCLFCR